MLETSVSQNRAVEVTAMLGDSVIAVHHLTQPRGGRISAASKALFAAGAFALLCAMGVFAYGVSVARADKRAFQDWTEKQGLPAIEFRATRISPAFDVLAIGGLISGLAMIGWGLSRSMSERRSPYFRIGRGKDVELATEDAPAGVEAFPIVAPIGDGFVFHHAPGMTGEMFLGGRAIPLAEVPQGLPLPDGARVRLVNGATTILVASVEPPRHRVGGADLDGRILAFAAGSAALHAVMLLFMFMIPDDMRGASLDPDEVDRRLVRLSSKPPEDARKLEEMAPEAKKEEGQTGKEGEAMKGPSGVMGSKESKEKDHSYAMKDNGADKGVAREAAKQRGASAGILGVLRNNQGGAFHSIYSDKPFSSGLSDRDVYGGLIGPEGEAAGNGGFGSYGPGDGGGGTGLHTIGAGRYGTIGLGGKGPEGYGVGGCIGTVEKCGLRPRRQVSEPRLTISTPILKGGLDKNTIRRYIRQRLQVIQHCYEKQLTVKPSLGGTVNMRFTIDNNGRVIGMVASGLDEEVDTCVGEAVKSIQFPADGGIVEVTSYPIHFHPPGS